MHDIKPLEKSKFSGKYFKIILNRRISFTYSLQIRSIKNYYKSGKYFQRKFFKPEEENFNEFFYK